MTPQDAPAYLTLFAHTRGKKLAHSSLDKFRRKFGKQVGDSFVLCTRDVVEKDGVTYLPLYMAPLL